MSTTRANGDGEGFHVVVADDGSVPASELARLGLHPGARLRIVPEQRSGQRKSMLGALAGTLLPEAVDDLIRGLDEAKAERIAYFTGERQA
jgi:hypothetical protein